jgi:hypothetical protein
MSEFLASWSPVINYMVQCSKKTTKLSLVRLKHAKTAYQTMDYRDFAAAIGAALAAAIPAFSLISLLEWSIYRRRGSPYLWHLAAPGP